MSKTIRILQLYPSDMNIYGDRGNTIVLERRLEWHGYQPQVIDYNIGDDFPDNIDIVIGGGGQDAAQNEVQFDLMKIADRLKNLADNEIPMLMICGLYQLFGHSFKTNDGKIIQGIGLLDVETIGGPRRLTGNVTTVSDHFGEMVGYENHSGLTYLGDKSQAFAAVKRGAGNNGEDNTEGATYKNVIGTYLHGPLLPKNPQLADAIIEQAISRRYGKFEPTNIIDDSLAEKARLVASKRPR